MITVHNVNLVLGSIPIIGVPTEEIGILLEHEHLYKCCVKYSLLTKNYRCGDRTALTFYLPGIV